MTENILENLPDEPLTEFPVFRPNEIEGPASPDGIKFNWKLPKFSNSQLEKLSDIISDIGLVAFASVVLPAILGKIELPSGMLGVLLSLSSWLLSLWIRKSLPL